MTDQKRKLLKAKIATALLTELGRKPTHTEVERFYLTARVLYTAVLGLHFERKHQKEPGQLPIF